MPTDNCKKFAAHFALLPDQVVERPLVTVGSDGRILAIGQYASDRLDSLAGVEFHAGMLAPALVNAHSHLELACLKGSIPQGCGYAGFAAAMARVRGRFSDEERQQAIAEADRQMFEAGIGAVGDISNDDSTFDTKQRSRIEYKSFLEVFGLKVDNLHRMSRIAERSPSATLTPHSLYSLNDSLFRQVCERGSGVLSVHFMESPAERELFEGRGSLREWFASEGFECDFLHYRSPAERLAACAPAGRSLLLVHCTCVTQEDIDLIMSRFRAPVHWCLCPQSNAYISGLQPDVELLRRNGLKICIGTDSLASNTSLTMVGELLSFSRFPADEVLRWATLNGAEALGLREGAGRLEVGSRCGLTVVSGIDFAANRFSQGLAIKRLM